MTYYPAVSATCQSAGNKAYYYCSECGYNYSDKSGSSKLSSVTVSKTSHNYIEKVHEDYLKTKATCKSAAVYYKSCSMCGTKTTTTFTYGNKAEHTWTQSTSYSFRKSAATCTSPAIYYVSCSVCSTKSTDTFEYGSALGHKWSNRAYSQYIATEATCTQKATYYKSCSNCNEKSTDTFESGSTKSHSYVEVVAPEYLKNAATCTKDATYYKSCSMCGAKGYSTFTVSATGHTPGEMTIENEKAATYTMQGSYDEVIRCTVCGQIISSNTVKTDKLVAESTTQAPETTTQIVETTTTKQIETTTKIVETTTTKPIETTTKIVETTQAPVTTTQVIETTTAVVASEFSIGDINHDGTIRANDARLVLRDSAELDVYAGKTWTEISEGVFQTEDGKIYDRSLADINGDGKIRANDARKILRASAELENPADWRS